MPTKLPREWRGQARVEVAFLESRCSGRIGGCWKPSQCQLGGRTGQARARHPARCERGAGTQEAQHITRSTEAATASRVILGPQAPRAGSSIWWLHFKLSWSGIGGEVENEVEGSVWVAAQRTDGPQARSSWPEWLSRGFSGTAMQWQNQNTPVEE